MKLIRWGRPGEERPGVLVDPRTAVDIGDAIGDLDGGVLATWDPRQIEPLLSAPNARRVDLRSVRVGAPVPRPPKIVCIGVNYRDHAVESGLPIPEEPVVFMKAANTVIGPNDDVLIPLGSTKTDWEVELAVVIGRRCRYLADEAAGTAAIFGYTISNDISERAFQLERGGQWTKGKSCETFNPLGPWLVTRDEVADDRALAMSMLVNQEPMQTGSTGDMVFGPGYLVWYLSQFMILEPGDVINTGTPAGVGLGQRPPRYLKPGDVMTVEISRLGRQEQICRAARRDD